MVHGAVEIVREKAPRIEYDASPWGFGALLRCQGTVVSFFHGTWTDEDAEFVGSPLGSPDGQTTWEYLCLFAALYVYGTAHKTTGLIILGDNVSSLSLALSLKGSKTLGRISRELSWRRVRLSWRYLVGHLPAELNTTADTLSRLSAPGRQMQELPSELRSATRLRAPDVATFWTPGL